MGNEGGDDVLAEFAQACAWGGPRCRPLLPLGGRGVCGGDAGYDRPRLQPGGRTIASMLLRCAIPEYRLLCGKPQVTNFGRYRDTRSGWRGCRRAVFAALQGALSGPRTTT